MTNGVGAYEGDLIRPLGLVTLYCAYAEGEVDELLAVLSILDETKRSTSRWQIGRKLSYAERLARRLTAPGLPDFVATLRAARKLFMQRNELIHGRLFAGGKLMPPGESKPTKTISPDELVAFAEAVWTCKEQLSVYRSRIVLPALESMRNEYAR
jgi:hypothetical protein